MCENKNMAKLGNFRYLKFDAALHLRLEVYTNIKITIASFPYFFTTVSFHFEFTLNS